jgi:hypothetical protein
MKKLIVILSVLALLALLAVPAFAHGPCDSDGAGYGQDHIAGHTPHGPPDVHHNPGTAHQGFSLCLGVH